MAGRSEEFTLAMKREFPAVRAVVFRAFVDPNQVAKWFGPKGFTIPRVDFSPHVGERYRIEMQPPAGERFFLTGEVSEIDPPSRLAFTFVWEEPNPDDVETQVGLSLRDLGESTEVEFTQGVFKTEERRALHHDGWSDSFDKLDRLISAQA
jgi:uncharacterized protein YndB with AHSA1/START domain